LIIRIIIIIIIIIQKQYNTEAIQIIQCCICITQTYIIKDIMAKTRGNWTIHKEAFKILQVTANVNKISQGKILEELIFKHLSDPVETQREKCKELQKQFMREKERLDELEEYYKGKEKKELNLRSIKILKK